MSDRFPPISTYGRTKVPQGLVALILAPFLWVTRDQNPLGWFITWVYVPLLVVVVLLDLSIVAVWAMQKWSKR